MSSTEGWVSPGCLGQPWRPRLPEGTPRAASEANDKLNATHTVVSETRAPKVLEIVIYFEHRVKMRKVVPDQGAPNATHSVISGT